VGLVDDFAGSKDCLASIVLMLSLSLSLSLSNECTVLPLMLTK
jgi:hypothetical protein